MTRPVLVELAEALVHLRRVALQQRTEIDEFRGRLDAVQGMDTQARRKVIPLDAPQDPVDRIRGLYRGVHRDGIAAEPGELYTFAGSLWHCDKATTERPSKRPDCWTLCVKRGRASTLEED